jgi:hypothetical protein
MRLAAAVAIALTFAAGAAAYLTSTGSGSGEASVGTAQPVTITAGLAPSGELFPGSDGDVTARISNPNDAAVHIGVLALDPTQGKNGFDASTAGCNLDALAFTTQTNAGSGWDVPADGTVSLDLTASVHMATSASNACQGATFTVYLRAGP